MWLRHPLSGPCSPAGPPSPQDPKSSSSTSCIHKAELGKKKTVCCFCFCFLPPTSLILNPPCPSFSSEGINSGLWGVEGGLDAGGNQGRCALGQEE